MSSSLKRLISSTIVFPFFWRSSWSAFGSIQKTEEKSSLLRYFTKILIFWICWKKFACYAVHTVILNGYPKFSWLFFNNLYPSSSILVSFPSMDYSDLNSPPFENSGAFSVFWEELNHMTLTHPIGAILYHLSYSLISFFWLK